MVAEILNFSLVSRRSAGRALTCASQSKETTAFEVKI